MNLIRNTILTIFAAALCLLGTPAQAQVAGSTTENASSRYEAVVTGTVRDRETGQKLENVTVSLSGTTISTVTNADGYFALKVPRSTDLQIDFSLLGYSNISFVATPGSTADHYVANVRMDPNRQSLTEAIVYGDARGIVEAALLKVPQNYPNSDNILNAFYRETVQKGRRFISISEGVMDIYKTGYAKRSADRDIVQLSKARRLLSQKQSDTLGVKIAGGPTLSLYADVVKNSDILFDFTTLDWYSFSMLPTVMIDDRVQYVVSFRPNVNLDYALYTGKVYIDKERLSFTRAEFSLDLTDPEKATAVILYKKPTGLHFLPQELDYLVTYREQDGVTRLNYLCCDIQFKIDWRKLTFKSSYIARSEMAVVDREDNPERVLDRKAAFRSQDVFYDMVKEYWSADYWQDYNIIEPTESLENAVRRLKRRQ